MNATVGIEALIYMHVASFALWFGGLFGYVVIVWPAIMSESNGKFPRALLARIGMRTAPWIYVAMVSALLTFMAVWLMNGVRVPGLWMLLYGVLMVGLIANNVYGSVVAWPRIMLLPLGKAVQEWFWFRVRMSVALAVGLSLFSVAIITT
jgi:uncharacterized membrane protein